MILFGFSLKSSLLLIFFIHGLVFSSLLFIKGFKKNDQASYWLSFFTLLCVLYISPFMLGYAGWYGKEPYRTILFYIPFQQLYLIPPVLYIYFQFLLNAEFKLSRKHLIHFIPAFLYLVYSLTIILIDEYVLGYSYFYSDGRDKDFDPFYQLTGFIFLIYYLILTFRLFNRYTSITFNTYSFADSLKFEWAKRFLIALILLILIRILFFLINPEWAQFGSKFWYYLCFSILFYYISISGYVNHTRSITLLDIGVNDLISKNQKHSSSRDYNNLEQIEELGKALERIMIEEKMYLDPNLSVYELAKKIGTHPKKVSEIVNRIYHKNFNDYVNTYRVSEVISKIQLNEHKQVTLLGLALSCGFNSKSTFNRAFKQVTSQTPVDYIKSLK